MLTFQTRDSVHEIEITYLKKNYEVQFLTISISHDKIKKKNQL